MSASRPVGPPLPTFLVIGQAKCGTTSLCQALGHHPGVFFSDPKEPHFFTPDPHRNGWTWYRSLFRDAAPGVAVGEGSTSYTRPDVHRECAERIAEALPDVRLVFLVRDPIARAESDWKMRVREGRARWNDINRSLIDNPQVVELGMYWRNISRYRELFAEEQLLIVFLEDLVATPAATLRRVFRHVGVDEEVEGVTLGEANTARMQRKDGMALKLMRTMGLIRIARAICPRSLTRRVKDGLSSPWRYSANWDPAVLSDLQARYREASRPLLEHCGRSLDFWSYQPAGRVLHPSAR